MLRKRWVAAAALAASAFAAPAAQAETVYGLTDSNDLVVFDSATPGTVSANIDVTPNSVNLKGVDFRPATLQLYGLGDNGQLYRIDIQTGATTPIGAPIASLATAGDADIDFNPTVDRLRVVTAAGVNARVNPNNGVRVDTAPPDTNLNPGTPNVTGVAYTNNAPASAALDGADGGLQPDAPTTTLLDIDTTSDQLLTQTPPNAGTLTSGLPLGVNLVGDVGFDISTASTSGTGAVGANTAFLAGRLADTLDRFYTVNLTTGGATAVAEIGGSSKVKDIAVAPAIPQIAVLYTPIAGAQQIAFYRADRPGTATSTVPVSGTVGGEALVGIDKRPANSTVYGVGAAGRVYTLNLATGAATQVPAAAAAFSPLPSGDAGVDFNPAPGAAIRLVTDTEQNIAVDSVAGTAAAQTALDYPAGDPNAAADPNVVGVAYINPTATAPTPLASQLLYGIDSGLDISVFQGIRDAANADITPPVFINGILTTPTNGGALGIDIADGAGFDIAQRFNQQFGAFELSPAVTGLPQLYSVNGTNAAAAPANSAALIGDLGGVPAPALTTAVGGMTITQDNILPAGPTGPTGPTGPVATATYTIPTVTPTATATPTYIVKKKPRITAKAKPKRDKKKPFVFKVQGRLVLPSGVTRGQGCKGTVKIVAKKGTKTIGLRRTGIKSTCKYKARVKLRKSAGKRGKVKFQVQFLGNSRLLGAKAKTSAKYGKKKRK